MQTTESKSLYAYFGELGLFSGNIPGHTFYQLGLLDSISEKYGVSRFDFLNYIDDAPPVDMVPIFGDGKLGSIFHTYSKKLIDHYRIGFNRVISNIEDKSYSKLFLKARFRNLSTLEKKLTDASKFEKIIEVAITAGYDPKDIVVLDTDLSLSESFIARLAELGITREIPSITIPGIGKSFLKSCMDLHQKSSVIKPANLIYYGNLSFENYKSGHSKNTIINDIINNVDHMTLFSGDSFKMTVAAKSTPELEQWINSTKLVKLCPRENRKDIWTALENSLVSVNVSKDLYLKEGFIPARVYESVIFGTIPISYKVGSQPALTFNTVSEFEEICKFLKDCSGADYFKILSQIADSL